MVWNEYREQANTGEALGSDEEEHNIPDYELSYEEWCDWFSQELLNMWFQLETCRKDLGIDSTVMNYASFYYEVDVQFLRSSVNFFLDRYSDT